MTIDQFFRGFSVRMWLLLAMVLASNGALVAKLWHEQVQQGVKHRESIVRQSIRRERLAAVRGRIFSRDGIALADNVPNHEVLFHLHEMRQPRRGGPSTGEFILTTIERTALLLGREQELNLQEMEARLQRHMRVYPALPFKAFDDLNEVEMARLQALMPGFAGMEIHTRSKRIYPLGEVGAHLVGFVGLRSQVDRESVNADEYDYYLPEQIGRSALERVYDRHLRGEGGMRLMRVDNMGMYYDQIDLVRRPELGANLVLNLDSRAQKIAQGLLSDITGAFVAMDVRTGAVIAMVSSPSFSLGTVRQNYDTLMEDERRPLQNRAITADYAAGSIIKPLIALSALEEGKVTPDTVIHCPGYYAIGNTRIRCSARFGHGDVDLHKAIEVSCNTYFIDIGIKTGVDQIEGLLASAGIGQPTGIEIDSPFSSGLLPSRDEKLRRQGTGWFTADTALISIGQGFIAMSPLQAAVFTAAIANGGLLLRPRLVKAIETVDGKQIMETQPDVRGQLQASDEHLAFIRETMHSVVWGKDASATTAQTPLIELAGKTGTAEVGPRETRYKNTWFICFGPYESPRYAVAVFVENGVSGGRTSAPVARRFFEAFLSQGDERNVD